MRKIYLILLLRKIVILFSMMTSVNLQLIYQLQKNNVLVTCDKTINTKFIKFFLLEADCSYSSSVDGTNDFTVPTQKFLD